MEQIREEKRLEKLRKKEDEDRIKAEAAERIRAKAAKEQEEARKKEEDIKAAKQQKKTRLEDCKVLVGKKVDLPEYGPMFLDYFLEGCNEEEYNEIMETLRSDLPLEEMRQKFRDFVTAVKERQSPSTQKKAPPPPGAKRLDKLSKWSEEEIALLTKGIIKYPAGLGNRWVMIQEYIGGSKTVHEVTEMAKELSVKNIRGENNIKAAMEEAIKASISPTKFTQGPGLSVKKTGQAQVSQAVATAAQPTPSPTTPTEAESPTSAAVEWTQTQQKSLEAAMKQFPATMEKKERWTKIAEAVPGKTAKDCIDRVKEIKEKMAKKAA